MHIYCDSKFKPVFGEVKDNMDIDMQYSAPQACIPKDERNNRTFKERIQSMFHQLLYKTLPKIMMQFVVTESAKKLNYFSNKHRVS